MASARLCQPDGGGAAPRRSRTTRRSSLQYEHERGASAPSETLGGDAPSAPTSPARQRGFLSRMGAGLRSAKIGRHSLRLVDPTPRREVIPPSSRRFRRPSSFPLSFEGLVFRAGGVTGWCGWCRGFARIPGRFGWGDLRGIF